MENGEEREERRPDPVAARLEELATSCGKLPPEEQLRVLGQMALRLSYYAREMEAYTGLGQSR